MSISNYTSGEGVMGSGYDDGLKGPDVLDGIEGSFSRYAPSFETLQDYASGRGSHGGRAPSSQALIERTVEASVLTTLLRRHGILHPPGNHADPAQSLSAQPGPVDMERFSAILVAGDGRGAVEWLAPWRHRSGQLDDRMAGLLSQAARQLGSAWEDDSLSFAEVSLGVVTLQRVLREFAPPPHALPLVARRMLLAPMPGEVHCFGLKMLGIRFQQAGWDCQTESQLSEEALLCRVGEQRYDVVGLSTQCAEDEDRAAGLIIRIRQASCEPRVRVLLGGARFAGRPGVALALGADLAPLPFEELSEALDRLIPADGA
ncbi:MAG: cobalamin-dependent protein [Methylobacterium sp.]|jgi:methanogenic corrinoid protein MtbC1|nr:cobalamin-dependent protein [Methylobacterium sp.]